MADRLYTSSDADEVLRRLETSRNGLSDEEAARRLRHLPR